MLEVQQGRMRTRMARMLTRMAVQLAPRIQVSPQARTVIVVVPRAALR